ncbi:PLD nuclease N-terminal domain-containing protein [Streptomyces sp. NPDC058579]|uniref:PLD nuclease N-terminal domain-containing protein n=1 Tax=Streptomyces sp. NPDC058579 TaxID=3346548 RepID=UPI00366727F5
MLRALMFILPLALTIYAFIDCLNTPEDEAKHLPKVVWVIIILLFWIVGPVVWFVAGKKRKAPAGGRTQRSEWVAPDDNPEFLKSIREEKGKDESLPEEDLKKRDQGEAPDKDRDKDKD